MRKLVLTPSEAGYSATPGSDVLSVQLSGGPSRTRLDFVGSVATVNVSWNIPVDAFNYLQAFYRTGAQQGGEPFLIDLILDGAALVEYEAKFIPESYQVVGVQGLTTMVTAQLEVKPAAVDAAYDEALMDAYEAYGDQVGTALDALAYLVNVVAPATIPG
jgi:hypothetical protein